ncbi:acetate--CoA ligase family protein [Patescibacteria group bacterium]
MQLNHLFNPQTIAVIGASTNQEKIGHQIFKKLLTSAKTIIPINPKRKKILNRTCYSSVLDYKNSIDQAIISIPAQIVPLVLKQCLDKQIKSVVIVSAGFAETGSAGQKLEQQLKTIIKNSQIKVLGPNCLGYSNTQENLDITFALQSPNKGNIALVSQSGAIGSYIFDWSKSENLGLSKFVSLGNRIDINENHCLDYLSKDKDTKVVGLYLESFADGTQFLKTASQVTQQKPVIVLFGGQTQSGKKAAQSHTAALSPKKSLISTAIKQSGCIQAHTLQEFTDLLEVFALEPELKDNDIAILTNAGGPSILAADQADQDQLHLTSISDVLGDAMADKFKQALINLTKIKTTDAFLIIISPQTNTELELTAKYIVQQAKKIKKPVIVSLLGGDSIEKAEDILKKHGIATIEHPKNAIKYLKTLYHYYHFTYHHKHPYPTRATPTIKTSRKTIFDLSQKLNQGPLSWKQIQLLADQYKLPLVKTKIITDDLPSTIKDLGFPLVLKSDPSEGLHRTEKKGVYLNLNSQASITKAYQQISKNFRTILAQPQLTDGHELFIGFQRQAGFPPMITLGSGGIYTELYQDISHFFLPLNKKAVTKLLKQTKIGQIIFGYRGQELAKNKIIDLILNTSQLMLDFPNIKSIDINPAIVTQDDIYLIDVKILLSRL